jgi:hypothetical protein
MDITKLNIKIKNEMQSVRGLFRISKTLPNNTNITGIIFILKLEVTTTVTKTIVETAKTDLTIINKFSTFLNS